MSQPSRLFALRPIAAALASATAFALAASLPAVAQIPQPSTDTQALLDAAKRAPRNDLLQIYREALANDATYAASRYQQQAAQERVPQARSGLLPNLGATGRTDLNRYDSSEPDITNSYNVYGGGLNLTVPVYRPQNWEALEQAKISVMTADLTLQQSTQDLALRVSTAYFNVLAARDQLIALEAAKKATLEQLQQAKREFEVGTKTIIDTNEAQARYDQIVAQEQVALGTLLVRRSELQTIIGRDLGTLAPLRDRPNLMLPQPADLAQWVRSAEDTSYAVQIARGNYEIATREVQRQRDGHKPTLDLVGGYNVSKFNGTQSNEFINPRINTGTVGLQLNVPIYQGGLVQSRVREALSLQDRSNAELESARRSSANAARDAYTGVNFGLAQVRALESAEVSARTQLDSTQLGYQVGVRILLDVLNATTQLVQTQRDLKRARYDFLLAALRLKASSGRIDGGGHRRHQCPARQGRADHRAGRERAGPWSELVRAARAAAGSHLGEGRNDFDNAELGTDGCARGQADQRYGAEVRQGEARQARLALIRPCLDQGHDVSQRPVGGAAMLAGEAQRRCAHAGTAVCIAGDLPHRLDGSRRVLRAHGRARADRIVGRLGKVEGVRSDHHRDSHPTRLDEVVTAKRQQAAADERDMGRRVVHRHFAHRVAQQNGCGVHAARRRAPVCQGRATQYGSAARLDQAGHVIEALRMPRDQDHERFAGAMRRRPRPGRRAASLLRPRAWSRTAGPVGRLQRPGTLGRARPASDRA